MNFHKVGVVGSGIMGSGIAEVVATCGSTVVLRSRTGVRRSVLDSLEKSLAKKVRSSCTPAPGGRRHPRPRLRDRLLRGPGRLRLHHRDRWSRTSR
jgi:3-hydroxyacyl-CoA dehydrogenase